MVTESMTGVGRQERKERTRQTIVASALRLSAESGLAGVSLRHVAREVGIVPTAFYRHFRTIDEVGLVLVDEAFVSLRAVLRDVRRGDGADDLIGSSVRVLLARVRGQDQHFRFIARERTGGSAVVREAVHGELDLVAQELAADVAALPGTSTWTDADLQTFADLVVGAMVATTERFLATEVGDQAEAVAVATAETQLRMLVIGARNWRSDHSPQTFGT